MPRGNPGINIGLRVPERTVKVVDEWATKHGLTRTEAFRRIMQAGFDKLGLNPPAPARGPSGIAGTRAEMKGDK